MQKHNELNNDLVSVIIPVHNAEKYLDICLTSISAQTYPNIEVICVLDSCTDNSEAIIKQYPQIKIYKVDFHNVSKTRNYGIKRAKGAYIAFNDADDKWHPQRLEKQMQIFNQYSNVDLIFSEVESFNNQDNYWLANPLAEPSGIIPYPKILHLLLYQSYIKIQGVIVKKSTLDNSGYFNELFTHCEDHELWMRLAADKAIFYYLPEVLAYYRQHDGSLISNKTAIHNLRIKAVEMILNREDLPNTFKKKKNYYLAAHYRRGANLFYCERNYPLFKKNTRKATHLTIRTFNSKDDNRLKNTWSGCYVK